MIDIINFTIPKDEVLRYLGYKAQKIDNELNKKIDEVIEETKKVIKPNYVILYNDILKEERKICIKDTNLILEGKDIRKHLDKSEECALIAVTLGNEIERLTRLYERTDLSKALILDACATATVEVVCDIVEEEVKRVAKRKGFGITFRYSPGYGDLSLDIQKDFINTLKADKKIGITVSSHNILFPRKSVTAIIGLTSKTIQENKRECKNCSNYENCMFRREGHNCES